MKDGGRVIKKERSDADKMRIKNRGMRVYKLRAAHTVSLSQNKSS